MELRETIESINYKLEKELGKDSSGRPNFRVVFSEDQFEKRMTDRSDDGFVLLQPEVRLLPKYRQWIKAKYILERLVPVPDNAETDLITKDSYEPLWVFMDRNGNYLPPFFDGCKFVIDSMFASMRETGSYHVKYKDPDTTKEARLAQIDKVEKELFGNETNVGDALAYGYGVSLTGPKLEPN